MISGAVFTDRFVSQPFVEYMFLGGTPYLNDRIYEVAKTLNALKSCIVDLRKFYNELPPSSSTSAPSVFPHFRNFEAKSKSTIWPALLLNIPKRLFSRHRFNMLAKSAPSLSNLPQHIVPLRTRLRTRKTVHRSFGSVKRLPVLALDYGSLS